MATLESPAWLVRLTTWLEGFEPVFAHQAQRGGLRRYVEGVRCDSRRKSMAAMWARLRDPGTYQGLRYFITEATWDAAAPWRELRAAIPARGARDSRAAASRRRTTGGAGGSPPRSGCSASVASTAPATPSPSW